VIVLQGALLVFGLLCGSPAEAAGGRRGPAETIEDEIEEKKSAEQLELEERLKAIEAAQKAKVARVVVLQWKGTDTDYTNDNLQRNIKVRIARPDASFYPDIDLYQSGRKEPDPSVRHTDQRAQVPNDAIAQVMEAVEDVASIPWNALSEQDWGLRANDLLRLSDELWFVDRNELREPQFLLFAQIGRAAESSNNPSPPYYENVDGKTVNYFWYMAGAMAYKDPSLMSKITDQSLNASIQYYKDELDAGRFSPLALSFDQGESEFDPKEFTANYQVFINGLEETIKNPDGLLDVPLGRVDVYLKRADGHSLSDRVDLERLTEKYYFVVQNARKAMGLDFIDQLMQHPNECIPPLAGDILNYLSIYAKLHPGAEIYIVVPYAGSTAPGRLYLWRWDRANGYLIRVEDNTGGFPVRFAALMGGGIGFSGVDVDTPSDEELEGVVEDQQPGAEPDAAQTADAFAPIPNPVIDGVPIYWQLRGHYNRFFMGVGIEFKIGFAGGTGEKPFQDLYPTNHHTVIEYVEQDCATGELGCEDGSRSVAILALRERSLQRLVYSMVGFMLGRDAAVGFGPRGYFRIGWYNAPHAVDFTGHIGWTPKLPSIGRKDEERTGRVRGFVDADFYGGVMAPYFDTLYADPTKQGKFLWLGQPFGIFGFTAGIGLTF
jgi:hypothetical protein